MKKLLLGVALALSAAAAGAQDIGPYIGGHIGQATAKDGCDGTAGTGISCDDSDMSWKILGGYQFNRNFAVEIAYSDGGEIEASFGTLRESISASIWELVVVGMAPVADRVSVYGKVGIYRADVDDETNFGFSANETNNDLTFGAGVRFDVSRNVALRLEWQRYQDVGGVNVGGESDLDVISIGALYRF